MVALKIEKLTKTYPDGTLALKELSLEIEEGQIFGLIGANGAGKSTLIGILTNLIVKDSGSIEVFDADIDRNPFLARMALGLVPQEPNFNLFSRVFDTLYNHAGYYGISRGEAKGVIEELLKRLGLWEKRLNEVRTLSGGMRRRLMIARALVHKPRLLLLDEPTAALDVSARHAMWQYIKDLQEEGVTILLTSHYLEEIEHLCKKAAVIQEGKLMRVDTVDNLVASLDKQVYIATLSRRPGIEQLHGFELFSLGEKVFEVVIEGEEGLTHFITTLHSFGISVVDLRPKSNRLERLLLNPSNITS